MVAEDSMYKAVLEQLPHGIIIVNSEDKIVFVNETSEGIRHIKAESKIGTSVINCHPENPGKK